MSLSKEASDLLMEDLGIAGVRLGQAATLVTKQAAELAAANNELDAWRRLGACEKAASAMVRSGRYQGSIIELRDRFYEENADTAKIAELLEFDAALSGPGVAPEIGIPSERYASGGGMSGAQALISALDQSRYNNP